MEHFCFYTPAFSRDMFLIFIFFKYCLYQNIVKGQGQENENTPSVWI